MPVRRLRSMTMLFAATFALSLLCGCSTGLIPGPEDASQVPIGNLQGRVHGSQSPVSPAAIYLYQTGTTGYGSASLSLICNNASLEPQSCPRNAFEDANGHYYVKTDADGNFALGSGSVCTAGAQVYVVAVSGDSDSSGSMDNRDRVQMAGLGPCPSTGNLAQQEPYVTLNEISTVAFTYSMAAYGTNATNIGSPNTPQALLGIANAMANARKIVNTQFGQPPAIALALGSIATVPAQKFLSPLAAGTAP